jgi:hypothetical protein
MVNMICYAIVGHNTKIHDRSCSWLDAGTSIKRGGVKLDCVPKETLYDLLLKKKKNETVRKLCKLIDIINKKISSLWKNPTSHLADEILSMPNVRKNSQQILI